VVKGDDSWDPRSGNAGRGLCARTKRRKLGHQGNGQGGAGMATALFVVRASIPPEREAAFNRWYNEEHCPQVLQYRGAVSARRYKAILGEERYQYMAVYEFQDEDTLRRFLDSEHFAELKRDYDAHFGGVSERASAAYLQVWP
jgi:uncharacterized protein (DUF1330 family)